MQTSVQNENEKKKAVAALQTRPRSTIHIRLNFILRVRFCAVPLTEGERAMVALNYLLFFILITDDIGIIIIKCVFDLSGKVFF